VSARMSRVRARARVCVFNTRVLTRAHTYMLILTIIYRLIDIKEHWLRFVKPQRKH